MVTALVVGGNRGIGQHVALGLAGSGWRVTAASRTGARQVARVAEAAGLALRATRVDVRNDRSVRTLRRRWGGWHATLDALVVTAGTAISGPLAEIRPGDVARMLDEHVLGAYRLVRAFREPLAHHGGQVVLLLSRMGRRPGRYGYGYGTAKAALAHLAGCLAEELGDEHIRVNCVCPGPVDTDLLRAAVPDRAATAMPPADVARVIVQLLSPEFASVNGTVIDVPGR